MPAKSKTIENIVNNNNQITSLRSVASQRDVLGRFMTCLTAALDALSSLSTELGELVERDKADFYASIIKLPTGDGAAIAFPFDAVADLHLLFAKRLLEEVHRLNAKTPCPVFEREEWCDCHPNFHLRVGISAGGDCIIYKDINERWNVAGTVINLAARVMDLADGEQIIFTDKAHDKLTTIKPALKSHFRPLERVRIKGGFVSPHQYVGEDEPYIKRKPPTEVYLRGFPTKADVKELLGDAFKDVAEHMDSGFDELKQTLYTALSARSLNNRKSIYEAVTAVIRGAREHIRILRLGTREAEPLVIKALADKVNEGVDYEVVVLLDQNDPSRGFMSNHRDLLKLIDEDKREHYYHPRILVADKPLCFDVIIVDNKHVGLGFTRLGGAEDLESAIMLQDTTDKIAKHFREWFDRVIKGRAKPLAL
jgi:class 3 adenylate cyclase